MTNWGQTWGVVKLPTKTQQEFTPLWLLNYRGRQRYCVFWSRQDAAQSETLSISLLVFWLVCQINIQKQQRLSIFSEFSSLLKYLSPPESSQPAQSPPTQTSQSQKVSICGRLMSRETFLQCWSCWTCCLSRVLLCKSCGLVVQRITGVESGALSQSLWPLSAHTLFVPAEAHTAACKCCVCGQDSCGKECGLWAPPACVRDKCLQWRCLSTWPLTSGRAPSALWGCFNAAAPWRKN